MRGPLRRWSGAVLYFRHKREGALGQLEGYTSIDNNEIAEKLWSTRHDWSDIDQSANLHQVDVEASRHMHQAIVCPSDSSNQG